MAYADARPPSDAGNQNNFDLEQVPAGPGRSQPVTTWVDVSPEYFGVMGQKLVDGRLFDARDTAASSDSVVVVDTAWARRFFPGQSAVGKRLKGGGCSTCDWTTVVGVVSPVKYDGLDVPDRGVVYTPMTERGEGLAGSFSGRTRYLLVRTAAGGGVPDVRRVLHDLDPNVPFARAATVDELVDRSLEQPRGLSLLVAVLAAVALVLAVVGIYGVMAHHVQQQARDVGIRLALGSTPRAVVGLMVGRGMRLVAGGVAVGAALAVALARLLTSTLFGVSPADPATFSMVTLLLLGTALAACGLPALRAAAADPASVLRTD